MRTAGNTGQGRLHGDRRLCAGLIVAAAMTACGSTEEGVSDKEGFGSAGNSGAGDQLIEEGNDERDAGTASVGQECARETNEAQRAKINLHLVVDISGSMLAPINEQATRWHAVRDAIAEFIAAPASAGIDLALSYYPVQEPRIECQTHAQCSGEVPCFLHVCLVELAFGSPMYCEPDEWHDSPALNPYRCTLSVTLDDGTVVEPQCIQSSFCSNAPTEFCLVDEDCGDGTCLASTDSGICPGLNSCEPAEYATPAVPKQPLPQSATALLDSLGATEPDEFALTPTHVALAGAYQHTASWLEAEPEARSFVVLATDGFPDGCESYDAFDVVIQSAPDATLEELARGQEANIHTFVIGVVDDELDPDGEARAELAKMASAGGTGEALVVTADESVASGFLAALDEIRGGLPCEYRIPKPEMGVADLGLVNLEIHTGGEVSLAPQVDSMAGCVEGEHGWYYEDSATSAGAEPKIVLCPSACQDVVAQEDAQVDVVLGCKTVVKMK